jgi:hypothetical protein
VIAELSKLSTCPVTAHYTDVKRLLRYLRQTCTYDLVSWRPKPLNTLPHIPFTHLRPLDEIDRQIPMPSSIDVLCGYLDSTHDNCLCTRRYVSAYIFCLAGTAIDYRAKRIAAICLSSTECEFVTAIGASKVAKYLRAIFLEISIWKLEDTELYEDNEATIMIENAKRPMDYSCHIYIQHFALQEWGRNAK